MTYDDFSEIAEKECVRKMSPSKAKIYSNCATLLGHLNNPFDTLC